MNLLDENGLARFWVRVKALLVEAEKKIRGN